MLGGHYLSAKFQLAMNRAVRESCEVALDMLAHEKECIVYMQTRSQLMLGSNIVL